jgi:hypothetical protein
MIQRHGANHRFPQNARRLPSRRLPPEPPAASASPLTKRHCPTKEPPAASASPPRKMELSDEFQIDRKQQNRKIESRKNRSTLPSGDHFFVARILQAKMPAKVPFVKTVRHFPGWPPEKFLATITQSQTKAVDPSCPFDGPPSLTKLFHKRIVQLLQAIIVFLGFVL